MWCKPFIFQFAVRKYKDVRYTELLFWLLFCVVVKRVQIFKKEPPCSHCFHTLETVSRVIKPWKGNGEAILMNDRMHFTKELIHFHERNVRAGKKQMIYFTILPGNRPMCRNNILCEGLFYSNVCTTAHYSNRLYTLWEIFTQTLIEQKCHNFSVHNCVERNKL